MSRSPAPRRSIRLLGIASIGLGLFDYLTSDKQAGKIGMRDGRIFRLAGARELVSGAAIALVPSSPAPLVARLIGDAIDIGILSAVAARPANERRTAAWIGAGMVVAIAVVDAWALAALRRDPA